MEFSHQLFGAILDEVLQAGYQICRFDEPVSGSARRFYLRHDVDISPLNAIRLAEIAAARNVRSNFFFQINAETYQLFTKPNLALVKRIRELGHCVGLHIDEQLIGVDEGRVAATLDWFIACCAEIDRVVSFHRPSPAVLGKKYESFTNAYGPEVFGGDRYLSDSRRSLEFVPILRGWLREGRNPVQILLHPEWWYSVASTADLWRDLRSRRESELMLYMVQNFGKVFGSVLTLENQDHPV